MSITIFSKPQCVQCDQAKALLKSKNISYEERVFDVGQPKVDGVIYQDVAVFKTLYPQAKTAPQVLLNGEYLGGPTELRQHLG